MKILHRTKRIFLHVSFPVVAGGMEYNRSALVPVILPFESRTICAISVAGTNTGWGQPVVLCSASAVHASDGAGGRDGASVRFSRPEVTPGQRARERNGGTAERRKN